MLEEELNNLIKKYEGIVKAIELKKLIDEYEKIFKLGETNGIKTLQGEDGRINLDKIPHIYIPIEMNGWYCRGYIVLPTMEGCIKKVLLSEDKYDRIEGYRFQPEEKNSLLCPALAKLFGIETALYYLAKESGKECILSPNFLGAGEELIHASAIEAEITGEEENKTGKTRSTSQMLEYLEKYLEQYKYNGNKLQQEKVEQIKLDYLKQRFFNRFIGNTDEHLHNFGIIVKGEEVKIAPMFDYDFSLARVSEDTYDVPGRKTWACNKEMLLDNGKSDLKSFIHQYKDYPGMREFFEKIVKNIDIKNLLKTVFENTGIKLESREINKELSIINERLQQMKEVIQQEYAENEIH